MARLALQPEMVDVRRFLSLPFKKASCFSCCCCSSTLVEAAFVKMCEGNNVFASTPAFESVAG